MRSVWVGLRPLVKPGGDDGDNTKQLSREHTVLVGRSGMVTVTGGKWTTYRAMAEDVLERCFDRQLLPRRAGGVTVNLPLVGASAHGARASMTRLAAPASISTAAKSALLRALARRRRAGCGAIGESGQGGSERSDGALCRAHEMARSVEDVLARRSRLLFLDAAEAQRQAGAVAAILADELGAGLRRRGVAARLRSAGARSTSTLP